MNIQKDSKIGEVVGRNFHTAKVFESLGLDFCCGGKKSINEACIAKGIDPELVIREISKVDQSNDTASHFAKWDIEFLVDYIVNNHHSYVLTSIPSIEQHLEKVIAAHGERHPYIAEINMIFASLKDELLMHMAKEEKMLFPYIKKLNNAYKNNLEIAVPPFGAVSNPIRMMEDEHEAAGSSMQDINRITGGFKPPESACGTFRLLYSELKDFEADLHVHVHLENNILFPKAIELEERLNSKSKKAKLN